MIDVSVEFVEVEVVDDELEVDSVVELDVIDKLIVVEAALDNKDYITTGFHSYTTYFRLVYLLMLLIRLEFIGALYCYNKKG